MGNCWEKQCNRDLRRWYEKPMHDIGGAVISRPGGTKGGGGGRGGDPMDINV